MNKKLVISGAAIEFCLLIFYPFFYFNYLIKIDNQMYELLIGLSLISIAAVGALLIMTGKKQPARKSTIIG